MSPTASSSKVASSTLSEKADLPEPQEVSAIDVPIASLGDDDDDDDEGDSEEERNSDGSTAAAGSKGKRKAEAVEGDEAASDGSDQEDETAGETAAGGEVSGAAGDSSSGAHPWQAVWSAEKNAWYFWNTSTGEVTWTNPLEPSTSASEPNPPLPSEAPPLPAGPVPVATTGRLGPFRPGGAPTDIDPDLAYLLPPEARGGTRGAGPSSMGGAGGQTAQFNARTGRFTAADYKFTVDHLDEYNRMKRMNSQYFDQEAWERERAAEAIKRQREEAQGIASKPQITKKDMDRFKKQKMAKKMRSQAWLRD